jgi:hypothetical protein
MNRSRIIGFAILGIIGLIISQCTSAKRDDSGQISKSGDLDVFVTQIGDCLSDFPVIGDAGTEVSTVNAIPCNEPHHWQVFYKSSITLESYSFDGIIEEANNICNQGLDGLSQNISGLKATEYSDSKITFLHPTSKSWSSKNDRAVDCLIGSDGQLFYSSIFE